MIVQHCLHACVCQIKWLVPHEMTLLQLAALVVGVGHGAVHVGVVVAVVLGRVVRILGGVLVAQILLRKNKSDMLLFSR